MVLKPNDEYIGLVFNKETNERIDFISFDEMRHELDSFAQCGLASLAL
jgi:hypothetical protein